MPSTRRPWLSLPSGWRLPTQPPRLRAHLGVTRLSLPDAEEARAVTGYPRGAITPFGSTNAWPVIVDASAMDRPRVALGGGAHGVNVHLRPADLVAALGAAVADVTVPDEAPAPGGDSRGHRAPPERAARRPTGRRESPGPGVKQCRYLRTGDCPSLNSISIGK